MGFGHKTIAMVFAAVSLTPHAVASENVQPAGVVRPPAAKASKKPSGAGRFLHVRIRKPLLVSDTVNAIVARCQQSNARCAAAFPSYYRENNEHSANGGFLGLFTSRSFWGAAQELHYTQVTAATDDDGANRRIVEYQVGFGYIIAARQVDAEMKGKGFLDSTPASIKGKGGGTRFWAMLIGLAPDKLSSSDPQVTDPMDCTDQNLDPQSELVCTLDMQPTVTQRYYRDTSSRLANAMDAFRRSYARLPDPADGEPFRSVICPQVIDFRWKDAEAGTRNFQRADVDPETWQNLIAAADYINRRLAEACYNKRPNVKIVYRDGAATRQWDAAAPDTSDRPSVTMEEAQELLDETSTALGSGGISIGDGGLRYDRNSITQEYQRNRFYLSMSSKRSPKFDRKLIDHRFDIRMEGLAKSARLPSILASIISYEREDISQHLSMKLSCSGGTFDLSVPENPVANPDAYTELVSNARRAVDSPLHDCSQLPGNRK